MFDRHPALRQRVLISLFSGNAVSGVLTQKVGNYFVLKACIVHEPGSQPVEASGEIVIDQANVDYLQILEGQA